MNEVANEFMVAISNLVHSWEMSASGESQLGGTDTLCIWQQASLVTEEWQIDHPEVGMFSEVGYP